MINFAQSAKRESANFLKIRRWVLGLTTLGLGVYIVVVMGILGWTWYINNKTSKVNEDVTALDSQVAGLAENEVLVLKANEKASEVNTFLDGRLSLSRIADLLKTGPIVPSTWVVDVGKSSQTVTVSAENTDKVNEYADFLAKEFTTVKINSITWDGIEAKWVASVSFWGSKPGGV